MVTTLREKLANLPIERRQKIKAKAQQLTHEKIAELYQFLELRLHIG
jgi:hypothetical protein